jgi:branched-chain amino acid transport system permease protein
MGSSQRNIQLPAWLRGRREVLGASIGIYRSFLIVLCGALAMALQLALMKTRFGSRLRAAVDDARVARGLGIPVGFVFAATFAVGSGLAGLGGALGVELLGIDPYFPLKFMVFFLIVVTVGGTSGLMGPFVASLLLGVADVAGKYYLSSALGGFVIYLVLIVVLVLRPHGLFARAR